MTDVTRMLTLKGAKHTDVNTFTNTPGTTRIIDPESHGFYPRDYTRLERKLSSTDNRRFAATIGPKKLDPLNLGVRLRGVNGNTGGALVASSSLEVGEMFDSFFGANAVVPAGASTTATGGNGATPNITVTSGAGFANGDMILVATSLGFIAREVVSGGGTGTLVVDRTFSGTVTNGGTAFRGVRWSINRAVHKHVPMYFNSEGEDWAVDWFGCFGESLLLDFKQGDVVKAGMTWRPNNWAPATEANPSFTGGVAGSEIVAIAANFYIANFSALVADLKLSFKNNVVAREAFQGANGYHGYEIVDKDDVKVSGSIYVGDVTTLGELLYNSGATPPSVKTLQSVNTVYDCAIEVAAGAGQSFYCRLPALEFRGDIVDKGGLAAFQFEGYAVEPASGSPCRFSLF